MLIQLLSNLITKKKIITLIIGFAVLVLVLGVIFIFQKNSVKIYNDVEVKRTITENYTNIPGQAVSISSGDDASNISIKGNFIAKQASLKGTDAFGNEFIRIDGKTYFKGEDSKWKLSEKPLYEYESNILLHPEWIQLKTRQTDEKIEGKKYLKYDVVFEKPDQDIAQTFSQEQLEAIQLKGSIWIDPERMIIKKLNLMQGSQEASKIAIDYTTLSNAPEIKAPM